MNKDDYMESESGRDYAADRFSEDRSREMRPESRARRTSPEGEDAGGQPVSRRRRRIGEMRSSEGSSSLSRRYGGERSRFRREAYGRDEDSYRPARYSGPEAEPAQSDTPDYRERYKQKAESNRRRYYDRNDMGEDSSIDNREEGNRYHGGDDRGGYHRQGGRPGYGKRPRSYGDRPYQPRDQREGGGYRSSRPGNSGNRRGPGQRKGPNRKRPFTKKRSAQPIYDLPEISETEPIRLNKFIANSGICSRREADDLITAGAVLVNGVPVTTLGTKVTTADRVEVNRQPINLEKKVYVLLNKPRNCVTTSDDPQERMTVTNLVRSAAKERIYPVGRLDRNTTGVLLLTNDGELAAKLVHPSFEKKKIYHAWLDKEVSPEDMQKLADGIELEDGEMHADAISYVTEEDHSQVGVEIHSGRNRIVRRLFEALGYRVVKLDRVYFAGLTKKNLGRGKWRYLTQEEVNNLKMGAFE